MSQWDPNDPNNPYNQQWQQGQGQGQQGWDQGQQQQQGQQWQQPQQQGWDQSQQQQWQQPQQQGWDQSQQQQWQQPQQQGWDQGQQQQQWQQPQQQGWDQSQQQQWQQPQQQGWDQSQQQAAYGQGGYQQQPADQSQPWQQPQQQQQQAGGFGGGFGFGGGQQQPAYGGAAYQGAYNETFGDPSKSVPGAVATLGVNERVAFLRKTYAHLFGAILLFTVLEFLFISQHSPLFEAVSVPIAKLVFGGSRFVWLAFLGVFVAVGWVAERWAQGDQSKTLQYAGLGLYTLAEAIIFIPMLMIAQWVQVVYGTPYNIIGVSAVITLALFAGLTATVFITKKDFSFMRGILGIGSMVAMGLIVASIVFGFNLGMVFSAAMILLAGGYVLYYTSGVLHHYRPNQYVAASLALFAAIALLFWYVLRIVIEISARR